MTATNQHPSAHTEPPLPQPKIDWINIIKGWKMSGMSQAVYCEANNISLNQFTYQNAKLSPRIKKSLKLLPVKVMPSEQATAVQNNFVLHYPNGMRLHIPINVHPEAIKTLLSCLEERQC